MNSPLTDREIEKLYERLDRIEYKIDDLKSFKVQVIAIATTVGAIISTIISIVGQI
jgi:tetrahydromethanopterin S-methyltransferase subunit G